MPTKFIKSTILVLAIVFMAVGCNTQQTQPSTPAAGTPTAADVNTRLNSIVTDGLPSFGPAMRGVSDSFDNMYFAAKGGNWALAAYMGDVIGDYMAPTQFSRPKYYPQFKSFYDANLGDNGTLRKAINNQNFAAFQTAYTNTMNNMCNACHASLGFKFIKKIQASAPEANIDYTVKSNASENK